VTTPVTRQKGEIRMELWAARDKDGELWLFEDKPIRGITSWHSVHFDDVECMMINSKHFPSLKWESEPIRFEIKVKE
jgi:hypothetical protein